jgi:RNA polymerase sigma-70 factor (ECF subfamily)
VDARFQTTHWSLVLAAGTGQSAESKVALEELCRNYWFPLYAFVRRQGFDAEEARDLTQGFFARLLERRDLERVRPELGRFRSFLLASVRHFLSNELDRDRAKKRAPVAPLESLDARDAENRYGSEPVDTLTPEAVFHRKWADTVLDRTFSRLESEWSRDGRALRYGALRGHLTGEEPAPAYRELAETLGTSEDAVKMTVHRLRKRFGDLLRDEIARTVRDSEEIDDEIRYLLGALNG